MPGRGSFSPRNPAGSGRAAGRGMGPRQGNGAGASTMAGIMIGAGLAGTAAVGRAGARVARGGAFRLPESSAGASADGARAAAATEVSSVALMALQEADDATARNRRGAARARDMLRELSALQAGLLAGEVDASALHRLACLAEGETPPDPVLADALAGIGLRARIELARHAMRGSAAAGAGVPATA